MFRQTTYHSSNSEHMAVVTPGGVVLGNVGEVCEIVGVLTRTVDISYFMLANQLLVQNNIYFNSKINRILMMKITSQFER